MTGIGGVFFKSNDPQKIKAWYGRHLGLVINEYGSVFEFRKADRPGDKGYTVWSPFAMDTEYFQPSIEEYMINFRVENIEDLLYELKKAGIQVVGELESYEYGKFAHIMDPEGRKIELWEPVDSVFQSMYEGKTTK